MRVALQSCLVPRPLGDPHGNLLDDAHWQSVAPSRLYRRSTAAYRAQVGSVAATEFMAGIRTWIDRLGLSIKDAAEHVGIEADQLERVLKFPEETLPVRAVLQILGGLGLGLAGVDELSPVAVLRHLDQLRVAKGVSKKSLAAAADLNRTYMGALFQETKPEPRLETILKMAGALEVDLVIEKQRELPPLRSSSPPAPLDLPINQVPSSAPAAAPAAEEPNPSPPPSPRSSSDGPSAPLGSEMREPPSAREAPHPAAASTRPASIAAAAADDPSKPSQSRTAPPSDPIVDPASRSSATNDRPPILPANSPTASPPRPTSPAPSVAASAPGPTATTSWASTARETSDRTAAPTSASSRAAENPKQAAAANESPKESSTAAAAAAAAAAAVGVTAGRWVSDAAFARLTEQAAAAKAQIAEEQHRTAMVLQQVEHERQLAAQRAFEQFALERAADREAALDSAVVLGGTATAAVVGGSTALAFIPPEDRRTAQAVLSIAGGALSIAGAMAERSSTTRGALLGVGGGMLLAAVIDLIRQSASAGRGGLGGVTFRGPALPCLIVEAVAPRSNAALAGLVQGDVIISIDGVAVDAVGADAALQRTRGEPGTSFRIDVVRDYCPLTVEVIRCPV